MRVTNCTPPVTVWNREQGWTCEPFPLLEDDQVAVTINLSCGSMHQKQLEDILAAAGMEPDYFYLGINDPKVSKGTLLVYLISICTKQDEVISWYGKLTGLGIPLSDISIISPRVQKAFLQVRAKRRSVSSAA